MTDDRMIAAKAALKLRFEGVSYADIVAKLDSVGDEDEARELVSFALENQVRDDQLTMLQLDQARLEEALAGLQPKARAGDKTAVDQLLKVMDALDNIRSEIARHKTSQLKPAFPATPDTPGQPESRTAYQQFIDQRESNPWWEVYVQLRETWDWRKAAFIAWSAMPNRKRLPRTQEELASEVLGLQSTSTIRKWRADDPEIDKAIETARIQMAGDQLSDVLDAWANVATWHDPSAHRDRITYLEWQGVYRGDALRLGNLDGSPLVPGGLLDGEDLVDAGELMSNLALITQVAAAETDDD